MKHLEVPEKGQAPVVNMIGGEEEARKKRHYSRLFRRFILLTMICSLIPLLLVGWGINIHYTGFAKSRTIDAFRTRVEHHRKIIELFLKEHSSMLRLIAQTHTRNFLGRRENLEAVFRLLNLEDRSFTDLGVIDARGRHLAYVGPYDLIDRSYSRAFWFKEVLEKGLYISDMFMGFRQVPHFVIAVTGTGRDGPWILRATIDTEVFRSLVEDVRIGKTGEVYLVNREGIFQTSPRLSGRIMSRAPLSVGPVQKGIQVDILDARTDGEGNELPRRILGRGWLDATPWMLVVKQDYPEAIGEVNHANFATLIFLHLSALTILIVSVFITRHMISVIRKRDTEADRLNKQLMQAGKLAAIGELSAGVAHEINNPLAIILTERQLLLDQESRTGILEDRFKGQFDDSMAQIGVQVHRCKLLTQNLLRFSRRTESSIETVDLNAFLGEVIDLMKREARSSGVEFLSDLDVDLSPILSDPSQLQQVFLNLITNAIDAHDSKPGGTIRICTRREERRGGVEIEISDTGAGIPPENLDKIFDPFFSTKPVGKGTGLGLSICYGIVKKLGGSIRVVSDPGEGTQLTIFLPFDAPPGLIKSMADER